MRSIMIIITPGKEYQLSKRRPERTLARLISAAVELQLLHKPPQTSYGTTLAPFESTAVPDAQLLRRQLEDSLGIAT